MRRKKAKPKHYWNYRVVERWLPRVGGKKERFVAIHEAHYTGQAKKPRNITTEPVIVGGETLIELKETLRLMRRALSTPILRYEDFP